MRPRVKVNESLVFVNSSQYIGAVLQLLCNRIGNYSSLLLLTAIPIRAKSKVVDAFEIHARWKEEVELLKLEMANFLKFYTDVRIPAIQKSIASLQEKIDNRG